MSARILIVDDEMPIADILKYNLEKAGYETLVSHDGQAALRVFREEMPDLVLLDIMLPEKDGITVCRELRRHTSVPILMLTAKDGEEDTVRGLEAGADDYITKPFSPREVLARVGAQLRRARGGVGPDTAGGGLLVMGELRIDPASRQAFRGDEEVALTRREFELLRFMAAHLGKVVTREELLREVWGYEYLGDVRTVDVAIRRLREKVEDDPSEPRYIQTRRGVGYIFCLPED